MPFLENKPYLFISYAHKDRDFVIPVLEYLNRLGINYWYDNGIAAGSEWPEYIAKKIRHCHKMLCFISENYAASKNCTRELNFSIDLNKEVLSIYIKNDVPLSDGMKMQLGSYQAIFYEKYNGMQDFCNAMYNEPFISECKLSEAECLQAAKQAAPAPVTPMPAAPPVQPPTYTMQQPTYTPPKPKNNKAFCAVCIVILWLLMQFIPAILSFTSYTMSYDSGYAFSFIASIIIQIPFIFFRRRSMKKVSGEPYVCNLERRLYIITSVAFGFFINCIFSTIISEVPGIGCVVILIILNVILNALMLKPFKSLARKKLAS